MFLMEGGCDLLNMSLLLIYSIAILNEFQALFA
jgi:hypothetical protein